MQTIIHYNFLTHKKTKTHTLKTNLLRQKKNHKYNSICYFYMKQLCIILWMTII